MTVLLKGMYWAIREDWERGAKEQFELGEKRASASRTRLISAGRVVKHEVREGRDYKMVFAPAESIRPTKWASLPVELSKIKG